MSVTAISIGNFDGVHLGHAALLGRAREVSGDRGTVIVLLFHPHPATVLRPETPPRPLSTLEQRVEWLTAAGADQVIAMTPTRERLGQSPEAFLEAIVDEHAPAFIVEGPDFRFGRDRAGSIETLRAGEAVYGYRTIVIEPVEVVLVDQTVVQVRSSLLRWLVERGRVRDAARLLGRPYELCGTVVRGDQRGRDLDMPTANLGEVEQLLPADGVYGGTARGPDGVEFPAAISVGTKPTYGHHPRTCEAHLIGYRGPLDEYGWPIRVCFHDWIRDQIALPDTDALVAQMQRDVARVTETVEVLG